MVPILRSAPGEATGYELDSFVDLLRVIGNDYPMVAPRPAPRIQRARSASASGAGIPAVSRGVGLARSTSPQNTNDDVRGDLPSPGQEAHSAPTSEPVPLPPAPPNDPPPIDPILAASLRTDDRGPRHYAARDVARKFALNPVRRGPASPAAQNRSRSNRPNISRRGSGSNCSSVSSDQPDRPEASSSRGPEHFDLDYHRANFHLTIDDMPEESYQCMPDLAAFANGDYSWVPLERFALLQTKLDQARELHGHAPRDAPMASRRPYRCRRPAAPLGATSPDRKKPPGAFVAATLPVFEGCAIIAKAALVEPKTWKCRDLRW